MTYRLFGRPSTAATGSCNLLLQTGQVTSFCGPRLIPCEMVRCIINETQYALDTSILNFKQQMQKVFEQAGRRI